MMKKIIDLSEWQAPDKLNYDLVAKDVSLVILRVQYGSTYQDKHYQTHYREFAKRKVPINFYAWVRGTSVADMQLEARVFKNRVASLSLDDFFYWLDIEEQSIANMRQGINAYVAELRRLGVQKVGAYIAHHLYDSLNLERKNFDGIWLPHYGLNNGQVTSSPDYLTDLHQYTSAGRVTGYGGKVELNRLLGSKPLAFYTGQAAELPTDGWIFETGRFTITEPLGIWLRRAPNQKAKVLALLPKGAVIKYDAFKHQAGFVWLRQVRATGYGYLASGISTKGRRQSYWGYFN